MGDYEDRYPDAYGRGETPRLSPAEELKLAQTPRQTSDNQTRDKLAAGLRQRVGLGAPAAAGPEPADSWRHAPATVPEPVRTIEPVPPAPIGNFRGLGPRGYVRSSARIYEDLCDRLTENPFVDASDIDVAVTGVEVTLRGTVDSIDAARQAEAIAQETVGVSQVRNELILRDTARNDGPTPGDRINRSLGVPRRS